MTEFSIERFSARVFVHATESEEKVKKALKCILPEGAELKESKLKGHFNNPILLITAEVSNAKTISEIWQKISSQLSENEKERLRDRIEGTTLYLRLDKQMAAQGKIVLSEGGDVIHLQLKLAGQKT